MIILIVILFTCIIGIFFLYKQQELELEVVHAINESLIEYIREKFGNENLPTGKDLIKISKDKGHFDKYKNFNYDIEDK